MKYDVTVIVVGADLTLTVPVWEKKCVGLKGCKHVAAKQPIRVGVGSIERWPISGTLSTHHFQGPNSTRRNVVDLFLTM